MNVSLSLSYVTLIKPNANLTKNDLKSAYRLVPIHLSNDNAIKIAWQFSGENHTTYTCDCKLPFAASKSPVSQDNTIHTQNDDSVWLFEVY